MRAASPRHVRMVRWPLLMKITHLPAHSNEIDAGPSEQCNDCNALEIAGRLLTAQASRGQKPLEASHVTDALQRLDLCKS